MPDLFGNNEEQGTELVIDEVKTRLKSSLNVSFTLNPDQKANDLIAQIKWIGTHVKVEYIKDLIALQSHKSVAVRRQVITVLSNIADKNIIQDLENWKQVESDRQTLILLDSAIDRLARGTSNLVKDRETLQVSEFLTTIKQLIGTKNFVVEGEVAEINIYHQVVYFAIKDKETGERLDCLAYYNVLNHLDFTLNEGLSVKVTGKASLAKNSSKLRLSVSFIQLTGEGEFLRNLKILQAKLEKEGLFDINRKRKLPALPHKIALMVSKDSAAESDFLKVLKERRGGVEICLIPIKTQGDSALKILLNALNFVKEDIQNPFSELFGCQTVVLTRGGGSKDDLILFNQEQIVRAIYALPVPTLVAIGHEKDISLAEMSADQRASTPTQAAIMVSMSKEEVESEVNQRMFKINLWLNHKYDSYKMFTDKNVDWINKFITLKLRNIEQDLSNFQNLYRNFLAEFETKVNRIYLNILFSIKQQIEICKQTLKGVSFLSLKLRAAHNQYFLQNQETTRLIRNQIKQNLSKLDQDFKFLHQEIGLYDPSQALKRGYAMILQEQSGSDTKKTAENVIERWVNFKGGKVKIRLQDGDKEANLLD